MWWSRGGVRRAIVGLAVAGLGWARAGVAQEPVASDSLLLLLSMPRVAPAGGTAAAEELRQLPVRRHPPIVRLTTPTALGATVGGGVIAASFLRDPAARRPVFQPMGWNGWRARGEYYDKAEHAMATALLAQLFNDAGLGPWKAGGAACGVGIAFEVAQGYVSGRDILADCAAGALSALWRSARPTPKSRPGVQRAMGATILAGLAAIRVTGYDRDPGGYDDHWHTRAKFPVAEVTLMRGMLAHSVLTDLGAPPWVAAGTACGAAALLQGNAPGRRVAVPAWCLGAVVGAGWRRMMDWGGEGRRRRPSCSRPCGPPAPALALPP